MPEEEREARDVEEFREVMKAIREEVPALVKGFVDVFLSKEASERAAEAIGAYYKKLKEAGIPDEVALELTKQYAAQFNFARLVKEGLAGRRRVIVSVGKLPKAARRAIAAAVEETVEGEVAKAIEEALGETAEVAAKVKRAVSKAIKRAVREALEELKEE